VIRFNRWSAGVSPAGARATCPRFHRLHLQFRAAFFPVTLRLAECGSETLPPRRARRPRYVRCGLRFSLSSRAPASGPSACVERPSFPILAAMKRNRFPAGWDQARVQSVLEHYEQQTEDEALAEDEAAFRLRGQTVVVVPNSLVPEVTRLVGAHRSRRQISSGRPNTVSKPMAHRTRRSRTPGH